ncbi:lysine-specific demethylase JMJ28 isoform X2 [Raphanus sativus]|uniref:Lysine-specific demethylase JMJ28 isoform X2 n=1 Tax=Raphanus sativus TaxID=3726 RepID=A0A6J0LM43_RAPSA|nr:lysine-specific demethylase JMJ28 isoform X2 [Raphanus sativus]
MSANEAIPDEFRCNRSDGKQWRCKRRALEGKKLCETHTSQLTLKRDREKAAAAAAAASSTMKLARSSKGDESASSKEGGIIRDSELGESKKRKREAEEADDDEAVRKMQLDLIGLALKREAEKKNKKKIPKKIPKKKEKKKKKGFNGFVGEELTKVLPNGIMSISPPSPTTSDVSSPCDVKVGQEAISITSRRFRSKNIDRFPFRKMQAVPFKGKLVNAKKRCHWCGTRGSEDLISCLSCERNFFCVDCIEKRNKGSKEEVEKKCPVCCGSCRCKSCLATLSGVTECKNSRNVRNDIDRVLHLHYAVCMLLPVLKGINSEDNVEVENGTETKGGNLDERQFHSSELTSDDQQPCCDSAIVDSQKNCTCSSSVLRRSSDGDRSQGSLSRKVGLVKYSNGIESGKPPLSDAWDQSLKEALTDCKLKEVKGRRNNLSLRSLYSLELTRKLETSAEEIVSCYELPEVLDRYLGCPFCLGREKQSANSTDSHLKEASRRCDDVTGNFLYYPTVMGFQQNNLEHFQTHWSKGHPVIVRSVLKGGSTLNWDPVAMFCSYLRNSNRKIGNITDCMDWFEVEVGVKQVFLGSLRGKAETNTCQERLKLDGWLSSSLFKEHFPNHYAEILRVLPLPHYMDPRCGLLNMAADLPDSIQTPKLGPCLSISYRSGEDAKPDYVKKLGFETCDTVDILLHVTETEVSTKQICRIRKLMRKIGRVRSKTPGKVKESRFGSEFQVEERESSNDSCVDESLSNSCGAQWDVFRTQDVSKLLDYMNNHYLELASMDSTKTKASHPLLEQSYYLDEYHKARLKEEFDVEPWSFDQCVGEAVIVPAGCPYQNRKNTSCVNAVLNFLSPEHVTESIKRVDELNQLPQSLKTKANKIEVKKMAIHKVSEAIKEIRERTSSDSSAASRFITRTRGTKS